MNGSWTQILINELSDKSFREAYVEEDIKTGVAFQIRALRERNGWSQAELGRKSEKPQSVIARLEDPDYGRFSLKTLLDMAAAFDVALLVRFVPFSELIKRNKDLSPDALCAPDFSRDDLGSGTDRTASAGSNVINLSDRIMQIMRTGSAISQQEPSQDQRSKSDPSVAFVVLSNGSYKTA
jgi:transcriptional regulator with XRE-family HTH domain